MSHDFKVAGVFSAMEVAASGLTAQRVASKQPRASNDPSGGAHLIDSTAPLLSSEIFR